MEAITEVYESSWSGHDLLYVQAQNMEMLWQDFSHKLGDQVLIPINTYTNQFPEVRVSSSIVRSTRYGLPKVRLSELLRIDRSGRKYR